LPIKEIRAAQAALIYARQFPCSTIGHAVGERSTLHILRAAFLLPPQVAGLERAELCFSPTVNYLSSATAACDITPFCDPVLPFTPIALIAAAAS
jgi:hypothetical protein